MSQGETWTTRRLLEWTTTFFNEKGADSPRLEAEILLAHPDAPMSQVYGAPHLLRLFVRIGAMLAYTPLDEKSLALLLGYLHDFLKYLAKNAASLFTASDYKVASAEYHRKAL